MSTTKNSRSNYYALLCLAGLALASRVEAFQYDAYPEEATAKKITRMMESGIATEKNVPLAVYYLSVGDYAKSLTFMDSETVALFPWLKPYLENLIPISNLLVLTESKHFLLFTPADQVFLADYALPSLEKAADNLDKKFEHRPGGKIRVEIYPTKEDFSTASTLSLETLERSGAIGICKFHRLMIMSPKTLPLGYRWMDALAHEYTHLMVNELSDMQAELWLHEGTARYFETSYRLDPPDYLSPKQKTDLQKASTENRLVSFKRMSPSLVYLKDQDEVSLAFAQVSYSVSRLVQAYSLKKFVHFLMDLKQRPFEESFRRNFSKTLPVFEQEVQSAIPQEKWGKTVGAMDDRVSFQVAEESNFVGADVRGEIRLGDRMRIMGRDDASLIQYQKALEQEPDNGVVLLKVARVQIKLGNKSEAEKNLRRAVEKNPNYGTPYILLATLVESKEAVELLQSALAINPFDPHIHELLSNHYSSLGDQQKSTREREILSGLRLLPDAR